MGVVPRPGGLHLERRDDAESCRFLLAGDLAMDNADGFGAAVRTALERHPACLVIDVRGVEFVDSCGLRELVMAQRRCGDAGLRFVLAHPGANLRKVLRLTAAGRALRHRRLSAWSPRDPATQRSTDGIGAH